MQGLLNSISKAIRDADRPTVGLIELTKAEYEQLREILAAGDLSFRLERWFGNAEKLDEDPDTYVLKFSYKTNNSSLKGVK